MTISHRFVLHIFLLFIVSCSRLYHGSWNQPYFDENVQPDKLGKNVSSWEDGARIPEDEFSVEWWYIDAKLEDSSIVVAYFYKVHNITNQYFIGFNYTSPDGVDTFKVKRFKKNDVSFSTDSCNVQFGKNYFRGNLNKYSVYLDPEDFEGFGIDLNLNSTIPPYRPQDGIIKAGDDYFAWLAAVPNGKVTGNYTLNYLISNDFNKGIPLGKVSVFAGESGSGKSFICSGNLVKSAQELGCQVVLFDSENALDEEWLQALDVDTSPEKLLRISVSMIDDVAKAISEFMKDYKANYGDLEYDEMPKLVFVIDSLGMLLTPTDVDQFQKGDMKGDMGRKPKALTALVRNTVNQIAPFPIALIATNHTYASQDMFDPDDKISGGQGFIYASSIVVAMKKLQLKEDIDGNKTTTVQGIRAACKVMKSRYAKPFEGVQVKIPYEQGMDPYSGLLEMLESKGIVEKVGNKLSYISPVTGEEIKEFRKGWTGDKLQVIIDEWGQNPKASQDEIDPDDLEPEVNDLSEELIDES